MTFDAIKNMENVYVALVDEQNFGMVKAVAIENGVAQADFFVSGSRKAKTRTADVGGFEVTDYVTFTRDEINEILENLPEEVPAADKFNNYEFVSNGEFMIYPVYGQTRAHDEVGYYYYDPANQTIDSRIERTFIEDVQTLSDFTRYRTLSSNQYELQWGYYESFVKDIFNYKNYWSDQPDSHVESIASLQKILESFEKGDEIEYNGQTVRKYYYKELIGKEITGNNNNSVGIIVEAPYVMINENDVQYNVSCWTYVGWAGGKYRVDSASGWNSWNYELTSGAITITDGDKKTVSESAMTELQAKGFAINIPAGYRVGFWIKNDGDKFYSNRALNEGGQYYSAVKAHENGNMYFGLEDWKVGGSGNNLDCNDIVFFVKNAGNNELPEPVEPTPTVPDDSEDVEMSWILACEDLGSLNDYDFNDIVLDVKRVNTYTNNVYEGSKLVVKCLAAGGTLPATIYYDDKEIGEAHKMLGSQSTSEMINTYSITNASEEFIVDEGIGENWTLSENLDKFSIVVIQGNGSSASSAIITGATEGDVPQMIVVPGDWEWPTERTRIEDAYPEFKNWNSNALYTDWCSVKIADKVIGRK